MNISLHSVDFAALSPLLILLLAALALLLIESISEAFSRKYSAYFSLFAIAAAFTAAIYAPYSTNPLLTPWLRFDSISVFFNLLFLGVGFGAALLADSFFQRFHATHGEYYFLLLSALFGLLLIGGSADFLTLFIGLETLSIALYILCGYMKLWDISHESSLKYFLMGAIAAAFLLYGIALIYGAIGTTQFGGLMPGYQSLASTYSKVLFMSGIGFVTLGLAFKAAIVPFHVWAPDVYEGAPTPVTAFMSVGTKAGAFAAFTRVFLEGLPNFNVEWSYLLSILAILTLVYANFLALRQFQLRRFFAYSGISHAGYMLMPFVAGTPDALSALMFYLVVYSLATLGCFAVLSFIDYRKEGMLISDLNGLFRHSPTLAVILIVCLLTLAGIPPTAGFFAKFFVIKTAFEAGYYVLGIVGLVMTIVAAYYYLRIISAVFTEENTHERQIQMSWPAALTGIIASLGIVLLSIYPAPLSHLITYASRF
ncbi:MAG: NADH-quinone oxidoreductase subunit N [Parachlamydiales bacterium]|jgi:NADH-quinone oxidoreductase subunit N